QTNQAVVGWDWFDCGLATPLSVAFVMPTALAGRVDTLGVWAWPATIASASQRIVSGPLPSFAALKVIIFMRAPYLFTAVTFLSSLQPKVLQEKFSFHVAGGGPKPEHANGAFRGIRGTVLQQYFRRFSDHVPQRGLPCWGIHLVGL